MDINSVNLVGRSTKDVELRNTNNGTSVATISLAVNHGKDEASFFDVVCYQKTAENVAKYVQRGRQVVISGRLKQRKWQDKNTGDNRYAVEIIANQVQFVGSADNAHTTKDVVLEDINDEPISLDEIPF